MNTKHTPGPWHISSASKNAINAERNNKPIGIGTTYYDPDSVYFIGQDEAIANAILIAAAPDLFDACNRTPNPIGTGTMSNCHILLMAVVALRNEGHMTLANELEAIQQHQKVAIAKATQP